MGLGSKRDLMLISYNLMKGDNFLKFIKVKHDGDYSIKHQLEVSGGKSYLWKGVLPEEIREKFEKRVNEPHDYDPLDDSANRIWRIHIDAYEIDNISTPDEIFPECSNIDPSKISFDNMENPLKICKHCGNAYMPDYDFIEDERMCEHLNNMFGGTYEYGGDWPDYCSSCLEELYELDTAKDTYGLFKSKDVIK